MAAKINGDGSIANVAESSAGPSPCVSCLSSSVEKNHRRAVDGASGVVGDVEPRIERDDVLGVGGALDAATNT
jgi:hypothetical protein